MIDARLTRTETTNTGRSLSDRQSKHLAGRLLLRLPVRRGFTATVNDLCGRGGSGLKYH